MGDNGLLIMAAAEWWRGASKVVAIGRNYVAHAHELGNAVPKAPFWFLKPSTSIISSGVDHELAPGASSTHHEVELGLVIGSRARNVAAADAMEHLAGYCLALDMTD